MLHELRIENLLLIERAELRLEPGLNAITGETGAGKTVLAHSLDLLMGGRARPQIVRPGAEEAWVEGRVRAARAGARRPRAGRDRRAAARGRRGGRARAAGRRLGAHQRLHRRALGLRRRAAGARLAAAGLLRPARAPPADPRPRRSSRSSTGSPARRSSSFATATAPRTRRPRGLTRELAELREREGSRERDLDLMRFELAEIEAAAPDAGRGGRARGRARPLLRNAEGLRTAAAARRWRRSAAPTRTAAARAPRSPRPRPGSTRSTGSTPSSTGSPSGARRPRSSSTDLGERPALLPRRDRGRAGAAEAVEERLDALDRLKRKHGGSIEAVLAHARALPRRDRAARERRGGRRAS